MGGHATSPKTGSRSSLALALAVALVLAVAGGTVNRTLANGTAGNFEIDGNRADDTTTTPIDWSTPPAPLTPFTDLTGRNDDSFGLGSKNEQPSQWVCQTGSAPAKDDILSGDVAFGEVAGSQWAYVDFFRLSPNGSADVDYEFNKSGQSNPSCPNLPKRTAGDIIIAFDAEKGGKNITVTAYTWVGDANTGTFVKSPGLVEHTDWDGAVNIPNTIPATATTPAPDPGTYGEASLNVTKAFGEIACGEFSSVYMKSRASKEINSALKDRTATKPVNVGKCPHSTLDKAVRNTSTDPPGEFADTASASPGDVIEYRLAYTNDGTATAHNVVVSDPIPDHSTYLSCSNSCTTTGTPVVTSVSWNLGDVTAGTTLTRTFRVTLDATFSENTTSIANVASVDTDEEEPTPSDETTVTVDAPPASSLAKGVRNVTTGEPAPPADPFATSVGASPADTIEYQFVYTNDGSGPATGVTVSDEVPAHSTFVSCSDSCTRDPLLGTDPGTVMTWSLGTVAAGGSRTVTFRTLLDSSFAQNGTTINNIGTTDSDQEAPSDSNSTSVSVVTNPASALAKAVRNVTTSEPTPTGTFADTVDASPTDVIEYQLSYSNNGTGPATGVTITDPVPEHSTFLSCTGGCTTTGSSPGSTITWTIGDVAVGGSRTVTFQVTLDSTFDQNTTTITNVGTAHDQNGDTDSPPATVTVDAPPASGLVKSAADLTHSSGNAQPGDVIEYTLTYTNTGSGPATDVVLSDPVPADTTFSSCSDSCDTDGPPVTTVSWSLGTVAAGAPSIIRTFQVTLDPTFGSGLSQVCNTGTVTDQTGPTDSNQVCITVEAHPDLTLAKTADGTTFGPGQNITYTITYTNAGDGDATDVVITDPIPANTGFVSCSDSCTTPNGTATWTIGDVPAGAGGSVTLTVVVLNTAGCTICNTATLTMPASANQPAIVVESNELCVDGTPAPRPDLANASGSAFGAAVKDTNPVPVPSIDQKLAPASTAADGDPNTAIPASAHDDDVVLPVAVPADGSVLKADVVSASSDSAVTAAPAEATSQDFAETANVNIAAGLVTATAVRAYAEATATGTSTSVSSIGSTIKNLKVNGESINEITPNKRIGLPALAFGPGSYVAIYEEIKSTSAPTGLSGGTYAADITVNMIRVHVTDKLVLVPGDQTLDVTVSSATAHADFPQVTRCSAQANQSVSGHAFMLSETTDPAVLPIMQGYVAIPATGGYAHQGYDQAAVPANGSGATNGTWVTNTTGTLGATDSTASSYAAGQNVCILKNAAGVCTISAEAVRSESNSTADATSASSNDGGPPRTFVVNVNVLGAPVTSPVDNEVVALPGIGFVILNEQVPDATAPGHTGLTVSAVHVVVTKAQNPFNLPVGADIIVAQAHSDATFLPPAP